MTDAFPTESPFLAMQREVQAVTSRGRDVVSFLMGEPDFPTPPHIARAGIAAIRAGDTRYTAMDGTCALKEAIAFKMQRDAGLSFGLNEIVVTNGGTQVLFNLLMATLAPRDEVIVPAPFFPPYLGAVKLAKGRPVVIQTSADKHFVLQPEALRNAITPSTKWLLLNSPNNPSGAVLGAAELRAIAEVLRDFPHVGVISDEIYEAIIFDEAKPVNLLQVAPDLRPRVVILNGVSKTHSMTGWRIGYAAGPQRWIENIAQVSAISTFTPNAVSQVAATVALAGDQSHVARFRASYESRRNLLLARLRALPRIECTTAAGAFYVFPSCQAYLGAADSALQFASDTDFCLFLLRTAGVATMPGSAFGMPGHFRLSYAIAPERISLACDRIRKLLAPTKQANNRFSKM